MRRDGMGDNSRSGGTRGGDTPAPAIEGIGFGDVDCVAVFFPSILHIDGRGARARSREVGESLNGRDAEGGALRAERRGREKTTEESVGVV